MDDAIFVAEGDTFVPTRLANGPWAPRTLHGGPPAGLLARAVEQAGVDPALLPVRLTIDLFRPVPAEPLTTTARVVREGRRLAVVEASLFAGHVEVSRASALLLRPSPTEVPSATLPQPRWAAPSEGATVVGLQDILAVGADGRPRPRLGGFIRAIEALPVEGRTGSGRSTGWLRMPLPLVAGEALSPFVRAATLSDFGNAMGHVHISETVGMINADITLSLHRLPEGEWVCFDSHGLAEAHGVGMTETVLHDARGPFGRIVQALLANPRVTFGRDG